MGALLDGVSHGESLVILTAFAIVGAGGLASVATWAALRAHFTKPASGRAATAGEPNVVLLRPCAGDEPWLAETLTSSRVLGPHGRIRFLTATLGDSAAPACRSVSSMLHDAGCNAQTWVTGAVGPNRKADQLARAIRRESLWPDIVVVADCDVRLDERSLASVLGPVQRGEAELCFLAPVETSPRTWGDHASASLLDGSLHAFAILSQLDPQGVVGKLFAIRSDALRALGGFESLVGALGEDMLLARRVTESGGRLRMGTVAAESRASGRTVREVVLRYARWISVIRAQRPLLLVSYPLLFASTPGLLALAVWALVADGPVAYLALAAVVTARGWVLAVARHLSHRPLALSGQALRALVVAFASDFVLLASFLRALASRQLTWRGIALSTRGGRLYEVRDPAGVRVRPKLQSNGVSRGRVPS